MTNTNPSPKPKQRIGAGYIRESTEDQDKGFSPDNQKRQIEEHARKHNITITEWYKDLITGTSASKRDDFQKMMSDAMQHKFDIILVFHTSRFARNVQESRHYKDLLRKKLDIDVISITQHFGDWKEPSAFLNEGVNELFDEHYSRQLSFWVRNSLMEKRLQGYQRGNPPFGYYKKQIEFNQEKDKPIYAKEWLVHAKESKIVLRIYNYYATGKYSFVNIASLLNKEGIKSKYGNPFTYSSVKGILCNRVYLGYVTSPRHKDLKDIKTDKHPDIISQTLFDKVQRITAARRHSFGRPPAQHRFYLLQGLVYCYHCRKWLENKVDKPNARMIPRMYCESVPWKTREGKKETLLYACKLRREMKQCTQPDVPCKVIDQQVLDFMEGFTVPNDIIKMTLEKLGKLFDQKKGEPKDDTMNAIQQLERKKKRLTVVYTNTDAMSSEDYLIKVREIDEKITHYRQAANIPEPSTGVPKAFALKETEKFLRDFQRFWHTNLGDDERRAWIVMCIKRVWVKDKKVVAIEPHDDFKPLFGSLEKVIGQAPVVTPS